MRDGDTTYQGIAHLGGLPPRWDNALCASAESRNADVTQAVHIMHSGLRALVKEKWPEHILQVAHAAQRLHADGYRVTIFKHKRCVGASRKEELYV